jgi:hypothetical protein
MSFPVNSDIPIGRMRIRVYRKRLEASIVPWNATIAISMASRFVELTVRVVAIEDPDKSVIRSSPLFWPPAIKSVVRSGPDAEIPERVNCACGSRYWMVMAF